MMYRNWLMVRGGESGADTGGEETASDSTDPSSMCGTMSLVVLDSAILSPITPGQSEHHTRTHQMQQIANTKASTRTSSMHLRQIMQPLWLGMWPDRTETTLEWEFRTMEWKGGMDYKVEYILDWNFWAVSLILWSHICHGVRIG